jgi:hypothetical protein
MVAQHLSYTDPNYQNLDSFISIEGHVLNLEQTENLTSIENTQGKVSINGVVFEYKNKRKIKIAGNTYKIEDYFYDWLERKTKFVREIQSIKPTDGFILLEYFVLSDDFNWDIRPFVDNYIVVFKDGTLLFQLVNHTLYFGQWGKQWIIDYIKKAQDAVEPITFDCTNYTVNLDNDLKHELTLFRKTIDITTSWGNWFEYSVIFISSFFKEGKRISTESFVIRDPDSLIEDLEAIKK